MMHQLHTVILASSCSIVLSSVAIAHGVTERVSVGTGGIEGNGGSVATEGITPDGRFVAFGSEASNLVPNDTNGANDMFLRDRWTGTTERVSLGNGRVQANDFSGGLSISASGRLATFVSAATNLVPGGATEFRQAYVFDRRSGRARRVSVGLGGMPANGALIGVPRISANGRYVSFQTSADNLVPNDTNRAGDVFVHDLQTGKTERVSRTRTGGQICRDGASGGIMSSDGRFVSVDTACPNMVPGSSASRILLGYIHDRKTGKNEQVTVGLGGVQPDSSFNGVNAISPDGRYVSILTEATNLVPGGTNGNTHVIVRDRKTGNNELATLNSNGEQSNGFNSGGEMSADGRYVAFYSEATNLVPNDTNGVGDIFVRDRKTGKTRRVSVGPNGLQSNGQSIFQALSASGRTVVFTSDASNLVAGDTNGVSDVFVHRR